MTVMSRARQGGVRRDMECRAELPGQRGAGRLGIAACHRQAPLRLHVAVVRDRTRDGSVSLPVDPDWTVTEVALSEPSLMFEGTTFTVRLPFGHAHLPGLAPAGGGELVMLRARQVCPGACLPGASQRSTCLPLIISFLAG